MNVYIVVHGWPYEGERIEAVCGNVEKAREIVAGLIEHPGVTYTEESRDYWTGKINGTDVIQDYYSIEEHEVLG